MRNQLIIPLQAVLKYVCGIQRFHLCPRNLFCILPRMKKSMVYCSISKFFMLCYITFKKKTSTSGSQVDHMWRYFSFCEKLGPCIFPMLRIVGLMAGRQAGKHIHIHTYTHKVAKHLKCIHGCCYILVFELFLVHT